MTAEYHDLWPKAGTGSARQIPLADSVLYTKIDTFGKDAGGTPSTSTPTPRIILPPTPPPSPISSNLVLTPRPRPRPQLRLKLSNSFLGYLCGTRVLSTDTLPVMDRVQTFASSSPFAPPASASRSGKENWSSSSSPRTGQGLMRKQRPVEDVSSIFVSPPTPERTETSVNETILTPPLKPSEKREISPQPGSLGSAIRSANINANSSPRVSPNHSPLSSGRSSPTGLSQRGVHVLPEVRSPLRKTSAMAEESPQPAKKSGRRTKLFGFTELPDNNVSSPAGSASSSSDRAPPPKPRSTHRVTSPVSPSSAKSQSASSSPGLIPRRHPNAVRHSAPIHVPPRRRENGLKLNFDGIVTIGTSPEVQSATVTPSSARSALVRKKSGEVLKSAMKRSDDGSSSPGASPQPLFESKSCPNTPTCPKYVHFDVHLERIKLFLHDQKPQVVSRDGSPVRDDELEEYPFNVEEKVEKVLQLSLPNFPTYHDPESNLFLESIYLGDDRETLKGAVVCKNIAFQKWVAVRFTFDWWQTTSEVTAVYKDSVKGGRFDRFAFTVKLADFLPKIEQKTLFLAVRYNIGGQEFWDSNGGQNYQVLFTKKAPKKQSLRGSREATPIQAGMGKAIGGRSSQWSVGGGKDDRMADLRAKLTFLTAEDSDRPPLSPNSSRHYSFDTARKSSPLPSTAPLDSKSTPDLSGKGGSLAARYDFGAAFKTTRRDSVSPVGRTADLPDGNDRECLTVGKEKSAPSSFYSPKFDQNTLFGGSSSFTPPAPAVSPNLKTVPNLVLEGPSPPDGNTPRSITPMTAAPFKTEASIPIPQNSPLPSEAPLRRVSSAPPRFTIGDPSEANDFESSTPQLDASSSPLTAELLESPHSLIDSKFAMWSPTARSPGSESTSSLASYSSLIEQFCWAGDPTLNEQRRNHSASELDHYFSHTHASDPQSNVTTPRAGTPVAVSTPSTVSSYYSAYSNTPTGDDVDDVENVLNFGGVVTKRSMVY